MPICLLVMKRNFTPWNMDCEQENSNVFCVLEQMLQSVKTVMGHVFDEWALFLFAFHFLMQSAILFGHTTLVSGFHFSGTNEKRIYHHFPSFYVSYATIVPATFQPLSICSFTVWYLSGFSQRRVSSKNGAGKKLCWATKPSYCRNQDLCCKTILCFCFQNMHFLASHIQIKAEYITVIMKNLWHNTKTLSSRTYLFFRRCTEN